MTTVYRFADFRLDTRVWSLTRGGQPITLGVRAVRLLEVLVARPGECIAKGELLDAAWPGLIVEEANLTVQMTAIRRALKGSLCRVETLARRGYRFVGDVVPQSDRSAGQPQGELPPNNLPNVLSSLVGREKETSAIRELLLQTRLVTLVGAGGCGKTRLSLKVAGECLERFPDGAWFVELASLSDGALVPQTVAAALSIREQGGISIQQTLLEQLKDKRLFLILDNCEHILDPVANLVHALMRECKDLTLLGTSRERLGVEGEQQYRVPSLSVPEQTLASAATADSIRSSEAVRLFVERARLGRADFDLDDQLVPVVASICRRLDGIPLAIELAAARVRSLSVEQIYSKLDQRFHLLSLGARTATPRQQTLRSSLDWSYDLLDEDEQRTLQELSVFVGGFLLTAAEIVCSAEAEVSERLAALVDKSLVGVTEFKRGEFRYALLETVRQYAYERLIESGRTTTVHERHRDWFLGIVEQARALPGGVEHPDRLERLAQEHDNLRAALEWSINVGAFHGASQLCSKARVFWDARGHLQEGRRWCERVLAGLSREGTTAERANVLYAAAAMAFAQADFPSARRLHKEALVANRELGDLSAVTASLVSLAAVLDRQGDLLGAEELLTEALSIAREREDEDRMSLGLNLLGAISRSRGDDAAAQAFFEEALVLARRSSSTKIVAVSLTNLSDLFFDRGDLALARTFLEESLSLMRERGDKYAIGINLHNLGNIALRQAALPEAMARQQEGLRLLVEVGAKDGIVYCLQALATVISAFGDQGRAAILFGAVERLRTEIGFPLRVEDREPYERQVREARVRSADPAAFAQRWEYGASLSLERAVDHALQEAMAIDGTTQVVAAE